VGRFLLQQDTVDPDFLFLFLQSSQFIQAISGHDQSLGVPHVSPGQVEAVALPKLSIDGQRRLASRLQSQLAETDTLRQAVVAQRTEIERLPQRILDQAFEH
jgi:type I restriction enzyme S subunit